MIIFEFDVSFGGQLGQIIPIISACLRFCGAMFSVQIFLTPLWFVFSLHGIYSWTVHTTWEKFLGFVTIITFSPVRQLIQNSSQCSLGVLFFYCTKNRTYLSCVTWIKKCNQNEWKPTPFLPVAWFRKVFFWKHRNSAILITVSFTTSRNQR